MGIHLADRVEARFSDSVGKDAKAFRWPMRDRWTGSLLTVANRWVLGVCVGSVARRLHAG